MPNTDLTMTVFPTAIINLILEATQEKELLPWINEEELILSELSNSAAIHLIEANIKKINWDCLSRNPAAIHPPEKNQEKIDWGYLSANPAVFQDKDQSRTFDLLYNITF